MAGRVLQLLPTIPLCPAIVQSQGFAQAYDEDENEDIINEMTSVADLATHAAIFDDDELQALWKQGVESDEDWRRARDAVQLGERSFPPDLAVKLSANIAECAVTADGVLHGRENRIWVPDYEPLRTAIMQRTHDSVLTGHPGRDTMIGILLRRWFWPKMRESVRRFVRNCDICGRTTVWREAKAGFLRSLP
ncbi:hypothetical protein K3495_g17140, partial [Podosphaera aphanis]